MRQLGGGAQEGRGGMASVSPITPGGATDLAGDAICDSLQHGFALASTGLSPCGTTSADFFLRADSGGKSGRGTLGIVASERRPGR